MISTQNDQYLVKHNTRSRTCGENIAKWLRQNSLLPDQEICTIGKISSLSKLRNHEICPKVSVLPKID